jgi:hypothetical protein
MEESELWIELEQRRVQLEGVYCHERLSEDERVNILTAIINIDNIIEVITHRIKSVNTLQ